MKRFSTSLTLVGVLLVTVADLRAGAAGRWPRGRSGAAGTGRRRGGCRKCRTPKNLQFFPKDITGAADPADHAELQRRARRELHVLPQFRTARRQPEERLRLRREGNEEEGARDAGQLARDVNMKLQSELGKPAAELDQRAVRHLPSRRRDPEAARDDHDGDRDEGRREQGHRAVQRSSQAVLRCAGLRLHRRDAVQRSEPVTGGQQAGRRDRVRADQPRVPRELRAQLPGDVSGLPAEEWTRTRRSRPWRRPSTSTR